MSLTLRGLLAAILISSPVLVPEAADACSCIVMNAKAMPGTFWPKQGLLPRNARGVAWWAGPRTGWNSENPPPARRFGVERIEGGETFEVRFEIEYLGQDLFLIAPVRPMRPGATYRFTDTTGNGIQNQAKVVIDHGRLDPGRIKASLELGKAGQSELQVRAGGSCSIRIEAAQRTIEMKFPADVSPLTGGLIYTTYVDGDTEWKPSRSICDRLPPWTSWVGAGKDLVYASCPVPLGDKGLDQGTHTVRIKATLPGTDVVLLSEEVRLDLTCKTD